MESWGSNGLMGEEWGRRAKCKTVVHRGFFGGPKVCAFIKVSLLTNACVSFCVLGNTKNNLCQVCEHKMTNLWMKSVCTSISTCAMGNTYTLVQSHTPELIEIWSICNCNTAKTFTRWKKKIAMKTYFYGHSVEKEGKISEKNDDFGTKACGINSLGFYICEEWKLNFIRKFIHLQFSKSTQKLFFLC